MDRTIRKLPRLILTALLGVFAISCQNPATAPPPASQPAVTIQLSHDQCRAIVTAAIGAARRYVDNSGTGVIPREDWSPVIADLHPIRVEEEVEPNIIVYIVLRDDGMADEGFCVCQTDVTGAVTEPAGVTLELLCNDPDQEGILYRYRRVR